MSSPVAEGEVLAGKYRVERVLGTGGMGVVVAAMHLELDERVAIKFLLTEALESSEAVERFAREARAAVKIKSEHVARIIDVGKLDSGAPYMVMEYLEGYDLAEELEKRGPLSVEAAIDYVLQACEALAEAHALGIVHRDVKPGNLFLAKRADGTPIIKVLDFGISKGTATASRPEMSLTKTTAVLGSPLYMAPEQMRSTKDADARSDIWALGIILYELVTGRVAFEANSIPELCMKIMSDEPSPISSLRPGAPPGLDAIVLRCLEKKPSNRFASIAELATALLPLAPKRSRLSVERIHGVLSKAGVSTGGGLPSPASERPPGAVAIAAHVAQAATIASWGSTEAPRRTSRTGAIIGALLGAALVAGVGGLFLRSRLGAGATPASDGSATAPSSAASAASATPSASPAAPAGADTTAPPAVTPAAPASATAQPEAAASAAQKPIAGRPGPHPAPPGKPGPVKPRAPATGLFDDPK